MRSIARRILTLLLDAAPASLFHLSVMFRLTTLLLTTSRAVSFVVPSLNPPAAAFARTSAASFHATSLMARKPGVSEPAEIMAFVEKVGGDSVVVVDARNTNFELEPGDKATNEYAPIAGTQEGVRPQALNIPYDRANKSMDLATAGLTEALDTPIITHCGGGGRGQKAKDFLLSKGYTNVVNGGGPEDKECWAVFGEF